MQQNNQALQNVSQSTSMRDSNTFDNKGLPSIKKQNLEDIVVAQVPQEDNASLLKSVNTFQRFLPNKCQIFTFIFLDILAGITTGYGLGYTNNVVPILNYVFGWETKAQQDLNDSLISSALSVGAMIGCSSGGRLIVKGRRVTVFFACVLGMIGCGITVFKSETGIIVGRIIFGASTGCLAAAINRYVDEYIPLQWFSTVAPLYSVGLNCGTLIATFTAAVLPNVDTASVEELETNNMWRWCFGFPVILNFIIILGFIFLVKTDTPKYYLMKGDRVNAAKSVKCIYHLESEQDVEDILTAFESNIDTTTSSVSIKTAFTDPYYRRCSWVNIANVIFHELDGINVIFLYSATILGDVLTGNFTAREGVYVINIINTLASFVSIWTLSYFGRRTLILGGQLGIACAHFILATCIMIEFDIGIILSMALFMAIYQNTSGPVAWVYAQETLTDAALGIVLNVLFGTILVLSLSTPYLIDSKLQASGTFYLFGFFALTGFFVLYPLFKESKHCTEKEKKELYAPVYRKKTMQENLEDEIGTFPISGVREGEEEVDFLNQ